MNELQEIAARMWQNLSERPAGPLGLRFILQPIIASVLAVRDGVRDARTGRAPYFLSIVSNSAQRMSLLREGLTADVKVLTIAFLLDAIYQWIALKKFYPVEAIIVAIVLAYLPYLIVRGPAMRIARWWLKRHQPTEHLQS